MTRSEVRAPRKAWANPTLLHVVLIRGPFHCDTLPAPIAMISQVVIKVLLFIVKKNVQKRKHVMKLGSLLGP